MHFIFLLSFLQKVVETGEHCVILDEWYDDFSEFKNFVVNTLFTEWRVENGCFKFVMKPSIWSAGLLVSWVPQHTDGLLVCSICCMKLVLNAWGDDLNSRAEDRKRSIKGKLASATHMQTVSYIKPLFKKLKRRVCWVPFTVILSWNSLKEVSIFQDLWSAWWSWME